MRPKIAPERSILPLTGDEEQVFSCACPAPIKCCFLHHLPLVSSQSTPASDSGVGHKPNIFSSLLSKPREVQAPQRAISKDTTRIKRPHTDEVVLLLEGQNLAELNFQEHAEGLLPWHLKKAAEAILSNALVSL